MKLYLRREEEGRKGKKGSKESEGTKGAKEGIRMRTRERKDLLLSEEVERAVVVEEMGMKSLPEEPET
jgi:hypothetical protein